MCQVNAFAVLGTREAIVKLVRIHIMEPNHYAITTSECVITQICFLVSDSRRAKMELPVLTTVMVGTLVLALQAMREQTVRLTSMNVHPTLVKTKALALYGFYSL